jgi:GNAT superfamily N-acetyltransferase
VAAVPSRSRGRGYVGVMIDAVVTLAERPDLVDAMWDMPTTWPPFMLEDPVADVWFGRLPEVFGEYQLVALDVDGRVVGKVNSLPFAWSGRDDDLPARGWDAILERGFAEQARGIRPTAVSLLEARVVPEARGEGLSARLLEAAVANVRRLGLRDLFGPVRPTAKSDEPGTPMAEYVARVRDDGLPTDPWLRVHVRRGGRIVAVCPVSMTVPGTLAQWRAWSGLPMAASGAVDVPGALVPVHVSVENDHAVYVEPNVWVHHPVAPA